MDHRGRQDAARQHLHHRSPRHADRGDRTLRRRQVHVRAAGRRLHPSDLRHRHVRRPRHPCRVCVAALPDRDGPPGRRGTRRTDRQPGAHVCRRVAPPAGHHQRGPRPGGRAGPRRARDDQACRHPRRQALRRATQTRLGRTRTPDRPVAADPRRTDLRPGPRAGPPGDDDAAPARRRRPRRARRHPLADLPRRLRPGAAAGPGRHDRVLRSAQPDRPVDGYHQLGGHLLQRRRRPDRRARALPGPTRATPTAATHPRAVGAGQPDPHQRAPAAVDRRATAGAPGGVGPRLLRVPDDASVHHGRAVAVGARRRRLRRPGDRHRRRPGTQRTRTDPGDAQRRRHLHGHRADDPRADR